jgi:hypothetical protein
MGLNPLVRGIPVASSATSPGPAIGWRSTSRLATHRWPAAPGASTGVAKPAGERIRPTPSSRWRALAAVLRIQVYALWGVEPVFLLSGVGSERWARFDFHFDCGLAVRLVQAGIPGMVMERSFRHEHDGERLERDGM